MNNFLANDEKTRKEMLESISMNSFDELYEGLKNID